MRSFRQDDVFRSMHVLNGVLSRDARFAVYQVSETVLGKNKEDDRQSSSLWRVNLAEGEPKRLTAKGVSAGAPTLTADGKAVLFVSTRASENNRAQIYRLPLDGGEAEVLTSIDQGVSAFALSPDDCWIALVALEGLHEPSKQNDHVRIDRSAYRFDPVPGYLQDLGQAIYLMPARGGEPTAITRHDGIVAGLAWSPDSRELAVAFMGRASQQDFAALGELCIINREGEERACLDATLPLGLFWTPDGQSIGFFGSIDGNWSRQSRLWLVDRKGGSPVSRTACLDLPIGPPTMSSPAGYGLPRIVPFADGKHAIVPVLKGGEGGVYKISLSGPESAQPLLTGPRVMRPMDLVGTTLLYATQDCNTPSELWVVDLKTGGERALTRHNAAWHAEIAWPEVERVVVNSGGGVEVEGWVLKPRNAQAPYKTVLCIHGGPHAAYGYTYNEDFHELVGAGYAIAFANPRGSVGYGDAFSAAIVGRWGLPELEDFNAFLDELVKRQIIESNRLGVTGVSCGGHMSAWLIGHTDRFKAAVPEQGLYNLFSFYGTSDVGISLSELEMGGPPHEQVQRYWDLSPIAHAHKCKTPTLLIQGENDLRCPMEQAEQLYAVLKHNGCKVELLRLRNCNHGLQVAGPPALRRFRMNAMKDWFDRHV
jgi:dipeptidyl aminopeptidase/acylaminoacyl peptidase